MPERHNQKPTTPVSENDGKPSKYTDRQIRDASRLLQALSYQSGPPGLHGNTPLFFLEMLSKIALEHALEAEMSSGILSDSHNEYSLIARCAMQIVIQEISNGVDMGHEFPSDLPVDIL